MQPSNANISQKMDADDLVATLGTLSAFVAEFDESIAPPTEHGYRGDAD